MRLSRAGLALIKRHEGVSLEAYVCPAGVLTIGFGHTGPDVKPGQVIALHDAEALLLEDVRRFEDGVLSLTRGVTLTQGQFDALVSFAFNVGLTALANSTLRKRLLAGDVAGAAAQFGRWVKAGGKTLPGLQKRRADEAALFLSDTPARSVANA